MPGKKQANKAAPKHRVPNIGAGPGPLKASKVRKPAATVTFHDSGHVAVTDENGKRIHELEQPWPLLWAEHAKALGYDPKKFTIQTVSGKTHKIVEQVDGLTWQMNA